MFIRHLTIHFNFDEYDGPEVVIHACSRSNSRVILTFFFSHNLGILITNENSADLRNLFPIYKWLSCLHYEKQLRSVEATKQPMENTAAFPLLLVYHKGSRMKTRTFFINLPHWIWRNNNIVILPNVYKVVILNLIRWCFQYCAVIFQKIEQVWMQRWSRWLGTNSILIDRMRWWWSLLYCHLLSSFSNCFHDGWCTFPNLIIWELDILKSQIRFKREKYYLFLNKW